MSRIHQVFLSAVVIILMLTAGCTNTTGSSPLMTPQETTAAPPAQTSGAPAATNQPGAAGTTGAPGTCTADTQSDAANCGGCGYACPANALCQQGQCSCRPGFVAENNRCVVALAATSTPVTCPPGMNRCPDGNCYELGSSTTNCGICGNACPYGMVCSAATCTNLPAPATTFITTSATAAVTTVTTTTTTNHIIGKVPATTCLKGLTYCVDVNGQIDVNGQYGASCVNLSSNTANCGKCGHPCMFRCEAGECRS
jgi:hypothetical protein